MTTANIIRKTHHLFILGMALGACQGVEPDRPGAGLGDAEASGTEDADHDDDDDDGDDDGGATGSADGGSEDGGGTDAIELVCGNGVVEAGEECDDDNDDDLDLCMRDCRVGPAGILIDGSKPRVLPQYGNLGGGGPSNDACPNGQVITGIRGRSGNWMDQVQVECGLVQLFDPDDPEVLDLTIVPGAVLTPRGGGGGDEFAARCPDGSAVVGFGGRYGDAIDQLILSCAYMTIADDGESMALGFDAPFDLAPVGSGGGSSFQPVHCAEGEAAAIANIRSGAYVDAFGLTCNPVSLLF